MPTDVDNRMSYILNDDQTNRIRTYRLLMTPIGSFCDTCFAYFREGVKGHECPHCGGEVMVGSRLKYRLQEKINREGNSDEVEKIMKALNKDAIGVRAILEPVYE